MKQRFESFTGRHFEFFTNSSGPVFESPKRNLSELKSNSIEFSLLRTLLPS